MLKWILGILAVALIVKRTSVPNSVTTANGAPPEGNISSWANSGSRFVGTPDNMANYKNGATCTTGSDVVPVSPSRITPTIRNFQTRGFYSSTSRYVIPGRS